MHIETTKNVISLFHNKNEKTSNSQCSHVEETNSRVMHILKQPSDNNGCENEILSHFKEHEMA